MNLKQRKIQNSEFPNIYVHTMDMDTCVHAFVRQTPTDDYVIIINSRLSDQAQREAFRHEMWHIQNHDFEKPDVQQIEYEAHQHDKEERGFRDETTVIQRDF